MPAYDVISDASDRFDVFGARAVFIILPPASGTNGRAARMIGQIVSHYRILEPLGEGGMGAVYVAEDMHLGRRVAIKFPTSTAGDEHHFRARFLREARAVSKLSHPHIATIYDYGETKEGHPFLVMELIQGTSLSDLMHDGQITLMRAVELIETITEALGEAHRQGIVHRDVKPSNILINERSQVKVLDFGLAKQFKDEPTHSADPDARTLLATHTRSGAVVGTPLYLSPEQAMSAPVDARSDLFALGALLYECITGRPAFGGASVIEIAAQVIHVTPPVPSSINKLVPKELDAVVMKALEKRPDARYQSAAAMLDDLQSVRLSMSDELQSQRTLRIERSPKTAHPSALVTLSDLLQRPRVSIARLLLGIFLFMGVAGVVWWTWFRPVVYQPPPDAAQWFKTGTDALREGAYFQASKALERAVRIDDKYALPHARLAEAWSELDYGDRAKDELLRVNQLATGRASLGKTDALYLDAITATVTRDFGRAIRSYEELARQTPNRAEVYVDLGRAYENDSQTGKALESYIKATEIDQQYAPAFLRAGIMYGRKKDLASARAAFDKAQMIYEALGNVEGRGELAFQRGSLLIQSGTIMEARTLLQQALELGKAIASLPLQIKTMLQLSYVFHKSGDTTQAEKLAGDAVALAQANGMENLSARGLVDLGSVYLQRGDYDLAERYFNQALELAKRYKARRNEIRALFSLGSLRAQQSRPDEAMQYLEPALDFYQQNGFRKEASQVQLLVGRLKRQKGDNEGSLQAFQQQLQLAEETGDQEQKALSLEGIAYVLTRQGRYPQALDHFRQIYAIHKSLGSPRGMGNSLTNQANLLWQLGRYEEARARLDEALNTVNQAGGEKPLLRDIRLIEAEMSLSQRRFPETKASAAQVLELVGAKASAPAVQIKSLLGLVQILSGAKAQGKQSCREAVEMAGGMSDPWILLQARLSLAEAGFETGDYKQAQIDALAAEEGFARLGAPQAQWRAALVAARATRRAGDEAKAREYASHIPELLARIQQLWGADNYNSYLNRPDVQLLRQFLQVEFALSS